MLASEKVSLKEGGGNAKGNIKGGKRDKSHYPLSSFFFFVESVKHSRAHI